MLVRIVIALLVAQLFLVSPAVASGHDEADPGLYRKLVDLVLVRPLGLVPTVVAAVGCAAGLPVAWVMGTPVDARQTCLEDPLEFTFTRPLGRL